MAFKRRILIVDNDQRVIKSIKTILGMGGFKVAAASSFEAAKEIVNKDSFDAYLTELYLEAPGFEGIDGIDLIKSIRENDPDTPIFVLSAYGDLHPWCERFEKYRDKLHISGYFGKPLPLVQSPKFKQILAEIESTIFSTYLKEIKTKYEKLIDIEKIVESKKNDQSVCFVMMPFNGDFDDIYSNSNLHSRWS